MKYRKQPVVIDAIQFVGGAANRLAVLEFTGVSAPNAGTIYWRSNVENDVGEIVIRTLEGDMIASLGDWIIRGVEGEIYPCKPSIFAATYDCVPDPTPEQLAARKSGEMLGAWVDNVIANAASKHHD